jgi:nucleoside-diphosphate-sugar epimerase
MNVLVTGATGYLGAEIVRTLLNNDAHTVAALGRDSKKITQLHEFCAEKAERLHILAGDICTMQHLPGEVDTVVHAAALLDAHGCETRHAETIRVNVQGTCNLLRLAARQGIRRFVYISSQSVYGDQPPPWREESIPDPHGVYAVTKYAGELLVRAFGDTLDWTILRLSRIYGISQFVRWSEIIGKFVQMAYNGQSIQVHGDGTQRFDFVHVGDAAQCVAHLLDIYPQGWKETYNIGGGMTVSMNELVEALAQAAAELGWPTVAVERHPEITPSGPAYLELDITRALTALGWTPHHSFHDGLREYLIAYAQKQCA